LSGKKMLMLSRFIVVTFLLLVCSVSICAQSQSGSASESGNRNSSDRPSYDPLSRSPIDDMRVKLRLRAEEKEFKDNLVRAQEAETISNQLVKSFETNKTFSAEDKKKLERMEKLVKRVRNASGGDDDDINVVVQSNTVIDVLKSISEQATKLNIEFKKTTRNVVSASVIENANMILDLIRILRTLPV
jgi:hypothetical protein